MGRHRRPDVDTVDAGLGDVDDGFGDLDLARLTDPAPTVVASTPSTRTSTPTATPTPTAMPTSTPTATPTPATGTPRHGATVVARRGRAEERAARRGRARRRLLTAGAAVLAVLLGVLLVAGVAAVLLGGGGDAPAHRSRTAAAPRQTTLLLQVTGQDGTAAASALVGVSATDNRGSAVLLPSGLLVDVASSGNMPFGQTVRLPSPRAPLDALTDLLGVRVGNGWVLSSKAFAALVEQVGGVQVNVDADVVVTDGAGAEAVVARAGDQRLRGPAAAAYATYLAEGEPETVRLARFQEVLDRLLRQLPVTGPGVQAALAAVSAGSRSTLEVPRLAGLLESARSAAVKDRLRYDVLPVNDIDTGAAVDSYGVDSSAASALMKSLFAGSLQDAAGDGLRVLVENGVGVPDLVERARAELVDDGFRFVNGGNAPDLSDTDGSVVLIADGSAKSQSRGALVARSLRLPATAVEVSQRGQTVADVIVILGADFRP